MKKMFKKAVAVVLTAAMALTVGTPVFAAEIGAITNATISYNENETIRIETSEPIVYSVTAFYDGAEKQKFGDYAKTINSDVYYKVSDRSVTDSGSIWAYAFSYSTTIYYQESMGVGPANLPVKTGKPNYVETVITGHGDKNFKLTKMELLTSYGGAYYLAGGDSVGYQSRKTSSLVTNKNAGFEVGDRAMSYYLTDYYYSLEEPYSGFGAKTLFTGIKGTTTYNAQGETVSKGDIEVIPSP